MGAYMENLHPVQLRNVVHFGSVDKNLAVSSFAEMKIVISSRKS
jgi:hypothetical protein